jgi:hypothetical protein
MWDTTPAHNAVDEATSGWILPNRRRTLFFGVALLYATGFTVRAACACILDRPHLLLGRRAHSQPCSAWWSLAE